MSTPFTALSSPHRPNRVTLLIIIVFIVGLRGDIIVFMIGFMEKEMDE